MPEMPCGQHCREGERSLNRHDQASPKRTENLNAEWVKVHAAVGAPPYVPEPGPWWNVRGSQKNIHAADGWIGGYSGDFIPNSVEHAVDGSEHTISHDTRKERIQDGSGRWTAMNCQCEK
jgi:hypothetical protein